MNGKAVPWFSDIITSTYVVMLSDTYILKPMRRISYQRFLQNSGRRNISEIYRPHFEPNLYRAVRNRSLNFIRKEFGRPIMVQPDEVLCSRSILADEQMIYEHFYQKVQGSIEALPPKCKKIFLMSRYEGKSLREIARSQKISIRTVETHISKALKLMREALAVTEDM